MKTSDKYLKIVEWSEEDGCYIGHCPSLMMGGVHGLDEAQVYKELCKVVEEWVNIYKKDGEALPKATAGKKYSGKFNLRVSEGLHEQLSLDALIAGESLNSYCIKKLEQSYNNSNKKIQLTV